ncbi:MAG: GtrA family protein [Bacteroidales bacterium]|nr:GtrA family protein [Bacteroidales bacterium]
MTDRVVIWKFAKFCAVGFSGMVVDFGTTWLCKEKFGWNKYVSNSLGFILAASNNYLWNRIWTFHSTNTNIPVEYGKFFLISVIGLGINNLLIYLLHEKLKLNFYFAKLFAIGIVTIWNFTMNYFFTF